jgi:hypothetical protein
MLLMEDAWLNFLLFVAEGSRFEVFCRFLLGSEIATMDDVDDELHDIARSIGALWLAFGILMGLESR